MKIISSLLIILTLGCKENNPDSTIVKYEQIKTKSDSVLIVKGDTSLIKKDKTKTIELNQIIPDTTINKKLCLSNYKTLPLLYSNDKGIATIDQIRESPVVIFTDKSDIEYLIAYQYEGSTKNSFDCFEIGYLENELNLKKVTVYTTSENNFKTETDLCLGLTLEKLESIKGSNYQKKEKESQTILTYRNTDFENSAFLKHYNMPSYFMEFTLKENKVIKIKFGFDYP
jgi:hypothetical protein